MEVISHLLPVLSASVVCLLLVLPGSLAFQWAASSLPDGSHVTACAGDDVSLLWSFERGDGEMLVNVEWYYSPDGVTHDKLIANKAQDTFFTPHNAPIRVLDASNSTFKAGIVLPHVQSQFSGKVTVRVNIDRAATIGISEEQSVTVGVADSPALGSQGLVADIVAKVGDNTNPSLPQFHLHLSCGHFTHLGNPPVSVMWTTPTNVTVPSSSNSQGVFYLDLDTSHPSGDYTCFVPPTSPSLQCAASGSPMRDQATVSVNEDQLRLRLLESQLSSMTQQNANLTQQVKDTMSQLAAVVHVNSGLSTMVDSLRSTQNLIKSQNQVLLSVMSNLTQGFSKLKADNTALQQANSQLNNQLHNITDMLQGHVWDTRDFEELPQNCQDVQQYNSTSGQHTLFTRGRVYHAFCDQTTDGGGWTVIQRRMDGSEDFYRGWADYENGFGDVTREYWVGLEKLHTLTSRRSYKLLVRLTDFDGSQETAEYAQFRVDGPDRQYALHVSGYSGHAGNSLRLNDGLPFTTKDFDHDLSSDNCAIADHGAFWYGDCSNANPNGRYYASSGAAATAGDDGVFWFDWKRTTNSLKAVTMMIKEQK